MKTLKLHIRIEFWSSQI